MMEARLSALFKTEDEYSVLDKYAIIPFLIKVFSRHVCILSVSILFYFCTPCGFILLHDYFEDNNVVENLSFLTRFVGKTLNGLRYKPLFNYFESVSSFSKYRKSY